MRDSHRAPTLGRILEVAYAVPDLAAIEAAYTRWLGYRVTARGAVGEALARDWEAPALAGRAQLVLEPAAGESVALRFVAEPQAGASISRRSARAAGSTSRAPRRRSGAFSSWWRAVPTCAACSRHTRDSAMRSIPP